ncbi:MAG: hypothetical protein LUH11_02525 [Candidatus Gastranaerophilales bacterium]|nr:hypothetical protein [Candidatus Gastranaerophilales bacterium]
MYLKNILIFFLIFFIIQQSVQCDETIKAENNAYIHNNKGLLYLKDNYYYGAIKEFQIAIDLVPNSQASAAYYVNLGTVYEKIGFPDLAKPCYEKAVSINVLCFDYYLKLAQNYKSLEIIDKKISEFQNKTSSPLNDVMIGLLYIQKGQVSTGITILDDFCSKEPDLLITEGVKNYIDKIIQEKL